MTIDFDQIGLCSISRSHVLRALIAFSQGFEPGLGRQIFRKATIDFGLVTCAFQHARRKRIGVPIRIELNLGRSGGGNAVGIREETEQIIEAVILEIDDDDVLDIAELRG